ncbi:MAG: hypothetical protein P9L94_15035 [Candidatus Hinthialibacter antarcticus]|nr:hypothetical protein [Candidatus Hinthialibacter antarcticus]
MAQSLTVKALSRLALAALALSQVCFAQIHISESDVSAVRLSHPGAYAYEIGAFVEGIGDIDGDGFKEIAIGAPSFDPGGDLGLETRNGAVFVVSGKMLQHDKTTIDLSEPGLIAWSIIGRQESKIGNMIAALGDINGDGFDDFAFSSPHQSDSYIMYGGEVVPRLLPLNDFENYGTHILNSGASFSSAGDFNGDGFNDAALGRPTDPKSQNGPGRLSLLYGASSFPHQIDAQDLPSIVGLPNTQLGKSIVGGFDLKADGFSDLLISEPNWGPQNQGRAFVLEGSESLQQDFDDGLKSPLMFEPVHGYARTVHDVNGDGLIDFLLGVNEQEAWIVLGRPNFEGTVNQKFLENDPLSIHLTGDATYYGIHDVNGDGFADIAAAMPNATVNGKALVGQVMFLFGKTEWPKEVNISLLSESSDNQLDYLIIDGREEFDVFGSSVAGIKDIQGDGFDDVIIGAPTIRDPSGLKKDRPGSAYVIQGRNVYFITQTERSQFFTRNSD